MILSIDEQPAPLMSFNGFMQKYKLKNKATSNFKIQHILSSLSLGDVGIYIKDAPLTINVGNVNLDPTKGTL